MLASVHIRVTPHNTAPHNTAPHNNTLTKHLPTDSCPRAFKVRSDFYRSEVWQTILAKHRAIREKATGAFRDKDVNILHVYDAFHCRKCHRLPFPLANFTDTDFEAFSTFANEGFAAFYDDADLIKFHIGFFVDELLQRLGVRDSAPAWDEYPAQSMPLRSFIAP